MKYRKKPAVIEAMHYLGPVTPSVRAFNAFDEWLKANQGDRACRRDGADLIIPTLEGEMRASPGDWIIRGVQGELYPCKPDIFEATYEATE